MMNYLPFVRRGVCEEGKVFLGSEGEGGVHPGHAPFPFFPGTLHGWSQEPHAVASSLEMWCAWSYPRSVGGTQNKPTPEPEIAPSALLRLTPDAFGESAKYAGLERSRRRGLGPLEINYIELIRRMLQEPSVARPWSLAQSLCPPT